MSNNTEITIGFNDNILLLLEFFVSENQLCECGLNKNFNWFSGIHQEVVSLRKPQLMRNVKDMLVFVLFCESKSLQVFCFIDLSAFKSCEQARCGSEHYRKGADRTHNLILKSRKGIDSCALVA